MAREPASVLHVPLRLRWANISSLPSRIIVFSFDLIYQLVQIFIILLFKPAPPKSEEQPSSRPFGRIAVVGAGLTGVSTAAHCIAHNFDVTLYDKNESVGGIWSHVNSTSGLQINSLIYRFHPAVFWREGFPKRDEILGEIRNIWEEYKLESRTKLKTEVVKVERVPGTGPTHKDSESKESNTPAPRSQWLVYTSTSERPDGPFDAVVCTIGTCGDPMRVSFDGMDEFEKSGGRVVHSSELDQLGTDGSDVDQGNNERQEDGISTSGEGPDTGSVYNLTDAQPEEGVSYADKVKESLDSEENGAPKPDTEEGEDKGTSTPKPLNIHGKTVAIIGSGASGVEAAEWAVEKGASKVLLLARDDKWIIPRNVVFDTMLSMQPFGREMPLSFIVEGFLRRFHYGDLAPTVAPQDRGFFEGTPIVNDSILDHIRSGVVQYIRCSTERLTSKGVVCKYHGSDKTVEFDADVAVLATGFKRPSDDFLPKELFPPGYDRPNLYLQNFCTEDWSILMTNAAYLNAIGTVGHFHIGIYIRILLTFLLDKNARPKADDMKLWVDVVRFLKRGSSGGALGFFTYMELTIWLVTFHLFRPSRLRWIFFIMQGWGVTAEDSGGQRQVEGRIETNSRMLQ